MPAVVSTVAALELWLAVVVGVVPCVVSAAGAVSVVVRVSAAVWERREFRLFVAGVYGLVSAVASVRVAA